jgi:hypothetical protein
MLIGDLIRLGRIVRAAMPSASKSILQVTDVAGGRAATFLQRVYVVEVDLPTNRIAVHPSSIAVYTTKQRF